MAGREVESVTDAPVSTVYRKAVAQAEPLKALLATYVGQWVALSEDWGRVIAADPDPTVCNRLARASLRAGEVPTFYRVH